MIYRTLGRTGYTVSQLGFGAMRLPMVGEGHDERVNDELAVPMIRRAFEAGVNYIDTAVGYGNKDSQRAVGEALKGWRDKAVVSTKNGYYGPDEKEWWTHLEDSLERLGVPCIDIYNHHGLNWKHYTQDVEPRLGQWMRKAKDQGLIQHICCSFHDNNDGLRNLVDSGYVASITLQYNLLDRQLEDGIAHAHEKGVGIVVMGPVAGGRLGADSEVIGRLVPGLSRVPELALRFVLANPNVTIALSGMSTMQHVQENVVVAADQVSLSAADRAAIASHMEKLTELAKLYCTGCGYCTPCPKGVAIPQIFGMVNNGRVYGLWTHARKAYANLIKNQERPNRGKPATACADCGACEPKCPQKIAIRQQLKDAHEALTSAEPAVKK